MKYTYLSTWALPHKIEPQWEKSTNVNNDAGIFANTHFYKDAYIQIRARSPDATAFYIKASNMLDGAPLLLEPKTFSDFFDIDFDENLFVPVNPRIFETKYLEYFNASQGGYHAVVSSFGAYLNEDTDVGVTTVIDATTRLSDLNDLAISHPRYRSQMARLDSHQLVAVNGFLHQTKTVDYTDSVVYVKEGGRTSKTTGYCQVDLIDFNETGPIVKYPLSDLHIVPDFVDGYYGNVQFQQIPEVLEDKTVMLSIGGYLILPEPEVLTILSGNIVQVDLSRLDIERKIVEASKYLDLSSLELATALPGPGPYQVSALHTNALLEAFLRLSQSFLIVVSKTNVKEMTKPIVTYNDNRKVFIRNHSQSLMKTISGRVASYYSDQTLGLFPDTVTFGSVHRTLNKAIDPSDFLLLSSFFPEIRVGVDVLSSKIYSVGLDSEVLLPGV